MYRMMFKTRDESEKFLLNKKAYRNLLHLLPSLIHKVVLIKQFFFRQAKRGGGVGGVGLYTFVFVLILLIFQV